MDRGNFIMSSPKAPAKAPAVFKRSVPITIAALTSLVAGALGLAASAYVAVLFLQANEYTTSFIGPILKSIAGETFLFGIVAIAISILHIIVGFKLWRSTTRWGMVGITLAAVDIVIYSIALFAPILVFAVLPVLVVGTIMAIAIIFGWDTLR
jgi:hypothetical protein